MKKLIKEKKLLFITASLLTIINAALQLGVAFFMKLITDATLDQNMDELIRLAILSVLFFAMQFGIYVLTRAARGKFIKEVVGNLRKRIFEQLLRMDIAEFHKKNSAEYISLMNNDVKILEDSYFDRILDLVAMCAQLIATVVALIWVHPLLALVALLLNLLPMAVPGFFAKRMDTSKNDYSTSLKSYNEKLKDYFSGFEVIKSFNIEKESNASHNKENLAVEDRKFKFSMVEALMNGLSMSGAYLIMVIVFAFSAFYAINGNVEIGTMVAVVMLVNYLVVPIVEISYIIGELKSVETIKKNVVSILDHKDETKESKKIYQFNKQIQLRDVSYSFDENKVLKGIDLDIEKGKKYAIVGGSGSGKTTLTRLILGYYDNYGGEISMDGEDLKNISDESRYNSMSMIHQNVFMFDDSIYNNICLYKEYDEQRIDEVIAQSGLQKLVDSLPDGTESRLIDNGKNISGGEKQRFAIARALVKNTSILFMDEATSSLDIETATKIEKSVLEIDELTVVVVTHKLQKNLLQEFDEIIVLDNGEIVEKGDFDELIGNKDVFYSLYKLA